MHPPAYDAVIVGARIAGATLATMLARAGARVLLLDKDAMPSDHVLSTHSVSQAGMDVLDELGVGDAVRSRSPATRIVRMNIAGNITDVETPGGLPLYCPRRKRLDGMLQQAAIEAGARMIDRARVTSLIWNDGRVCGVRTECGERERAFSADLVIGADGRRSTVARLAGAEEYLGYDAPRAVFWGYWNVPRGWKTDASYGFDAYFHLGNEVRSLFSTDDDQLLIGGCPPAEQCDLWRNEPWGMLRASLASDPVLGPLIGNARPQGGVRGAVKERFFYRRAAGNGWALVGDAGHHKEYLLGDGITEALIQARGLAAAIGEGSDAALTRWWRARDVASLPIYFLGREVARSRPPLDLLELVFTRLEKTPALKSRMAAVVEHRLSPYEAIPIPQMLLWALDAAARGRWGIIGELLDAGRRATAAHREMRVRAQMLADAERIAA